MIYDEHTHAQAKKRKCEQNHVTSSSLVHINDFSIFNFKVVNKWFEPEMLAEHSANMFIGETGKSIF